MAFEIDKNDDGFEVLDEFEDATKIMVMGVGGGGGNAVQHMVEAGMTGVDYVVINTDVAALRAKDGSKMKRIQIGRKRAKGQGAGNNPVVGKESADESHDEIQSTLKDVAMVFVAAGMGGGTGTGAGPVVASIAKDMDILTVGVVTKPFDFEGREKMNQALKGIAEMRKYVDALIVIPNEKVREISNSKLSAMDALKAVDGVLYKAVKGITDLVTGTGFMNVDFADVTMALKDSGIAHMAIGNGSGDNKITQALDEVLHSPLLETSISGARRVLLNVSIPMSGSMDDFDVISRELTKYAHPNAVIKIGMQFDETLDDEDISIIAVATDFAEAPEYEIEETPIDGLSGGASMAEPVSDYSADTGFDGGDRDIDKFVNLLNSNLMKE